MSDEACFVLETDCSDEAMGCVLQQEQDGDLRVLAYASRALKSAKTRYCMEYDIMLRIMLRYGNHSWLRNFTPKHRCPES